jgi:hypothetical protein
MRGRSQICNVKDGRIRVTCPRCDKKKFVVVVAGLRKKTIRCVCGLSRLYTLNHRAYPRESTCGKALIIVESGKEFPVYLSDISLVGIGFLVPYQYLNAIIPNREISIKFRAQSGSMVQRRIRIKSILNNRVGAQILGNSVTAL